MEHVSPSVISAILRLKLQTELFDLVEQNLDDEPLSKYSATTTVTRRLPFRTVKPSELLGREIGTENI